MPFGIGPGELILILVVALIVFGPRRLPELGSSLGQTIREFRRATSELTREVREGMDEGHAAAQRPVTAPPASGEAQPAPPTPQVICGSCGASNPESGKFCGQCGKELASVDPLA